jgi:hypothetical protein
MTEKRLGAKPLDYHTDIINIVEPIIVLDNPKQEEYLKKRLIEALEDLPKPKKTGYLMMTPSEDKIENIKSFSNDEISFKRDLTYEFGFKRRNME